MDESTTTSTVTDDGAQVAQPADDNSTVAETPTTEPTETTTDSQEAGDSEPVDENLAWLQKKGIDPQSPEALAKVAEMYRNAERAMHESTQKKAELQAELQPSADELNEQYQDDPVAALTAKVQAMEMSANVNNFLQSNPEAKQYEAKMTEMVNENPNLKLLVNNGYLGLDNLLQMAKGADATRETTLKSEGGREALQKVVDKQQAKAVAPAASSSAMSTQGPTRDTVNEWYAGLTPEQRASPETQRTVASLLS